MTAGTDITRRGALGLLSALIGTGALRGAAAAEGAEAFGMTLGEARPFSPDMVVAMARDLAAKPWAEPARVPKAWLDLTYDQFREIWFDTRHALWRGTETPAQVEFLPAGLYFPHPIAVHAVSGGEARPVRFELRVFDTTDRFPELPEEGMGFSGIRVLGELVEEGTFQEYLVFQGASYFRAIARGQSYGISARGLALGTGSPEGEEFPEFTSFWIEEPAPGSSEVVIHALMDSPSVSGAYRFVTRRGDPTEMEVDARLFPRADLAAAGIAPGTSMFLYDQTNRNRFDDFRDAVHDSDGLLMLNGAAELLWRPLANPAVLEFSAFSDSSTKGFGLMQRARDLGAFGDLAAHYERRPSLWVEPLDDWGPGSVVLVEIPTDKEIYDNIVAFWRPASPLAAGQEHRFRYRLSWCATAPVEGLVARVLNTRTGARIFGPGRIFTIDFEAHPAMGDDPAQIEAVVAVQRGTVESTVVQANPATGGMRLDIAIVPPDEGPGEMRAELLRNGARVSEVWLYRRAMA